MPGLKDSLRDALRASPLAFGLIGRRGEHPDFGRRLVRRGDDLVIEGYPRSGNTFGTMAFRLAQPGPLKIGNHFHAPAQILRAARFGLPAMVVIRDPMPAALSYVVYNQGRVSAARALELYIAFHAPILRCQDAWVPALFEEIIEDFSPAIARMNAQFGTSFALYHNSPEADAQTKQAILDKDAERVAKKVTQPNAAKLTVPSEQKTALQDRYKAAFEAPAARALLDQAEQVFAAVRAHPSLATGAA